jgi:hypothetical protein
VITDKSSRNAIPIRADDLLNLRDIEQGLENLKRLPTADADIQIEPASGASARPGDSDLVVKYKQQFPLRTTLSLDDSGTEGTGKTLAGATVAWDNPLGLNDLAYISLNHDAFNHSGQGTGGYTRTIRCRMATGSSAPRPAQQLPPDGSRPGPGLRLFGRIEQPRGARFAPALPRCFAQDQCFIARLSAFEQQFGQRRGD